MSDLPEELWLHAVRTNQEIGERQYLLVEDGPRSDGYVHANTIPDMSEYVHKAEAWDACVKARRRARADALRAAGDICEAFALEITNSVPAQEYTDVDTCIVLRHRILALIDKETDHE